MILKNTIYTLFTFLILFCSIDAQAQHKCNDFSEYRQLIIESIQKNNIPGMQVAIVSKDSILWKENFGYANLKKEIKVTDNSIFRIASISKPFVAISLLMLQEKGLLNINDEYKELAPEVKFYNKWEKTHPVKLVHLLEHTSGFDDGRPADYITDVKGWSTLRALQHHPSSRTSKWKPGIFMSYSNIGTTCAAYVVERLSNQSYESFVKKNIFTPLNMLNSSYFQNEYVLNNLAAGYTSNDSIEVDYWHILTRPSGSLNSNVTELSKLIQLFLNRGSYGNRELLSANSIARIEQVETTLAAKSGHKLGYGLCMYSTKRKDYEMFFHHGTISGYISTLQYIPELEIGFIILTNTSNPAGLRKLISGFQDLLLPDTASKTSIIDSSTIHLTKEVEGWYEVTTSRVGINLGFSKLYNCIKINKENNQYSFKRLTSLESRKLELYAENILIAKDSNNYSPFVFVTDDNEDEYLQLPIHELNYKKVSGFKVFSRLVFIALGAIGFLITIAHMILQIIRYFYKKKSNFKRSFAMIVSQATVLLGLIWIIYAYNTFSFFTMGIKGFESIMFYLFSIAFAFLSFFSFVLNLIQIRKNISVFYLSISTICLILTIYLFNMEIIGLKTWVY